VGDGHDSLSDSWWNEQGSPGVPILPSVSGRTQVCVDGQPKKRVAREGPGQEYEIVFARTVMERRSPSVQVTKHFYYYYRPVVCSSSSKSLAVCCAGHGHELFWAIFLLLLLIHHLHHGVFSFFHRCLVVIVLVAVTCHESFII
jgi:hypothetical protein